MATNQKSAGTTVNYSNAGSAIASGAAVVIGNRVGIAMIDIAATSGVGPVQMFGEFAVTKAAGTAWAVGDPIYYDVSAATFSPIGAVGTVYAGTAWRAALSAATTGYVSLGVGERNQLDLNHVATGSPVTLTRADSGRMFTNLGASGAIVFNLPQDALAGDYFDFVGMAAQEIRVAPGAAGAMYVSGAKQTDNKYISFDDEGESVRVVADGNGDWITVVHIGTITVEG